MSEHVTELTAQTFDQVVSASPITVIDFWAPWCGPCKAFAPTFEKVASEQPDIKFAKVNTDDEQELGAHFQIRSIPTLMVIRDQVIVFSQAGAMSKGQLEQVLEKTRALDMAEVKASSTKA
jgi:thioredoxin 1